MLARSLLFLGPVLVLAACGGAPPVTEAPQVDAPAAPVAAPVVEAPAVAPPVAAAPAPRTIEVVIASKSGSKLTGKATFTAVDGGVKVTVQVAGAPPGKIATHVHETGDCSAPDAKSAGGHFNPASKAHGLPTAHEQHLGDLGNIEIAKDGTGTTEVVVKGANLDDASPTSYVGRAIIVHEKEDDGGQPVGNAGARIGCGVIAAAK